MKRLWTKIPWTKLFLIRVLKNLVLLNILISIIFCGKKKNDHTEFQETIISVGNTHVCAINQWKKVFCWGLNSHGQTGVNPNSLNPITTPHYVELPEEAISISANSLLPTPEDTEGSGGHSCAVLKSGRIMCWGNNSYGQLGNGTTVSSYIPTYVPDIYDTLLVSAGSQHSCAITRGGEIFCWGKGFGTKPLQVTQIQDAYKISAGLYHTCVITKSGKVYCFGNNDKGQLGSGTYNSSLNPLNISIAEDVIDICSGNEHNCVLTKDRKTWCWGDNSSEQSGIPISVTMISPLPMKVEGVEEATSIACGAFHTCVSLYNGDVKCWGNGFAGNKGDGNYSSSPKPTLVRGISGVSKVYAGGLVTCGVLYNGKVKCWGLNVFGQLGDSKPSYRYTPTQILSGISGISTGIYHTCMISNNGKLYCIGSNHTGQLGNGETGVINVLPVEVLVSPPVHSISAGLFHTCAITYSGLFCWGLNMLGQIGTKEDSFLVKNPITVKNIIASEIDAGIFHTCSINDKKEVFCWGANESGQCGKNPSSGFIPVPYGPIAVGAIKISAGGSFGGSHTCAIFSENGTSPIKCWGKNNFGQLGNGSNSGGEYCDDGTLHCQSSPVYVLGITDAIDISAGAFHTCAITSNGSTLCWGRNANFEIGNKSNEKFIAVPVLIPLEEPAMKVSAGLSHTCAILRGGDVYCWGSNSVGQLALDPQKLKHSSSPQKINFPNQATAVDISTSFLHTCALLSDSSSFCWGYDQYGQSGGKEDYGTPREIIIR